MKAIICATCLAMLLPAVFGCGEKVKPGQVEVKRPVVTGVVPAKVQMSQVEAYYETAGTVQAGIMSGVASRIMGTVVSLKVREGDRVSAGDVLMELDDRDMRERARAAEAGYREAHAAVDAAKEHKNLAEVTHRRYRALFEEKVISRQEMDQVETQRNVAESEYLRAQGGLARATASMEETAVYQGFAKIRAPFSGVVTSKKIDVGGMAIPGMTLLTAEDDSYFRVEAAVDERLAGKVKPGMTVFAVIGPSNQRLTGHISEVVPAVDPATRTFLVKVRLKDRSLKSGLYAKLLIPEGKREAILVPRKALVTRGQLEGLFAVDEKGVVTYRLVRTGSLMEDRVEILSGLKSGDRIIIEGVEKAVDGGVIGQQPTASSRQ